MIDIAYSILFGAVWIVLALTFISGRIKEVRDEVRQARSALEAINKGGKS